MTSAPAVRSRRWTRTLNASPVAGAVVLVAAAAVGSLVAASRVPIASRPNVLLITVDTLRPDALGWISGRNATPVIDGLALGGVRFRGAVSPVPLTLPSHVSLMTGLIPRRHGVRDNGQVFSGTHSTLATLLKARGYATAAFVSGYPLRKTFGLDVGFDVYDDRMTSGSEGWVERLAGETTAAALGWAAKARSPWFLWVHYYDPHDPYTPPRQFLRPGPRGAYDGEVAYVDSAVGQLLLGLPAGSGDGRITVLTGDHGESLGEHGENGHGFFIYDTTVLVPMIFHAPGRLSPHEEITPAKLVDVAPTLLELLGLPPLRESSGQSLTSLFAGKTREAGAAYVETQEPWIAYGWAPLSAWRESRWKLIEAPRPELYDLASDPAERENVVSRERAKTVELLKALRRIESRPAASSHSNDDAEAEARLRSLGYLGGGSLRAAPGPNLPDPKDRLVERNLVLRGEGFLRQGALDSALAAFSEVLKRDPGNRFALLRSGIALLKKGDLRAAIPPLEEAVRLDPEQAENQFALADALTRTGEHRRAIPHWMEAVRLEPRRVAAWSNLGTALGLDGKLNEAAAAFERAVQIEPRDPLLLANLAFAERALKKEDAALTHLRLAASLSPAERFPFSASLGLLLLRTPGNAREASFWLRRARPQEADFAEALFQLARLDLSGGDFASARKELAVAIAANPGLRRRAEGDPNLKQLLH